MQNDNKLEAPIEWHEANIIMGKDVPSIKEIFAVRTIEDKLTGTTDEVKSSAGFRGAIASGQRQEDKTIKWDWNDEEDIDGFDGIMRPNLLDFHAIPGNKNLPREFSKGIDPNNPPGELYWVKDKLYGVIFKKVEFNPPPDYKEQVAGRMREGGVDEELIQNYLNK